MILESEKYSVEVEIEETRETDQLEFAYFKGTSMSQVVKASIEKGFFFAHRKLRFPDGQFFLVVSKPKVLH